MNNKTRPIAFYLPQFYPTPENDDWWEPGFTEWTNVTRSKPLFRGHYQPRLPRDLGFYDLRVPETREQQAELARFAGIEGFCYWHYWFSGRRLLDVVFREVVESSTPNFPFCLCWANHSWYAKTWTPEAPDKLLIEQTYPGVQDYSNHFYAMLPAFKDRRYMKVDGKLIFGIFAPIGFDIKSFADTWNTLAYKERIPSFWFFALAKKEDQLEMFDNTQYDAVVLDTVANGYSSEGYSWLRAHFRELKRRLHIPYAVEYDEYVERSLLIFQQHPEVVPCVAPDFDHSPRSGWRAHILKNSTPEKFYRLCKGVSELVRERHDKQPFIFIKAWNEWAEGNYMEPDQRWGRAYIEASRKAFAIDQAV